MAEIEAASFSDMDKDGRRDVLRKYRGVLGGDQKVARATEADLASLGIQVEHVGADGLPVDGTQRDSTEG